MTRKQRREEKLFNRSMPPASISFTAICNIDEKEVESAFASQKFSDLALAIMRLPMQPADCVEALMSLRKAYDDLWDLETIDDLCEDEVEYQEDDLRNLYDKVSLGLQFGQGMTSHTQMRLELLQTFLSLILSDAPTFACFGTCCDNWKDSLEDDNEDNT